MGAGVFAGAGEAVGVGALSLGCLDTATAVPRAPTVATAAAVLTTLANIRSPCDGVGFL